MFLVFFMVIYTSKSSYVCAPFVQSDFLLYMFDVLLHAHRTHYTHLHTICMSMYICRLQSTILYILNVVWDVYYRHVYFVRLFSFPYRWMCVLHLTLTDHTTKNPKTIFNAMWTNVKNYHLFSIYCLRLALCTFTEKFEQVISIRSKERQEQNTSETLKKKKRQEEEVEEKRKRRRRRRSNKYIQQLKVTNTIY